MADGSSRWVRMHDIFGKSLLPPDSAEVVEKAVEVAIERGDVAPNAAYLLVEYWAADYLAGVPTDRQRDVQRAADRANREAPTGRERRVHRRGTVGHPPH
jgi:hypothetical protein